MNISVFGLGYVGAVSVGCLARDGHTVIGVDIDPVKLELIRQGKSPIIEEGINELIAEGVKRQKIQVTNDTQHALMHSDLSFVCVGTPPLPDGSQDLNTIQRCTENIGTALKGKKDFHTIVIRSTVLPGTVEEMIKPALQKYSGKVAGKDFGLCFQPEFLREGSSIKDYYNPPFTVVGADSERAVQMVKEIFSQVPGEFQATSIKAAEMLKYCCNGFHALKVTFANEIGRLCQAMGIDSHAVMGLVCKDTKLNVSPAYLKPGFAFGGSCLPKDLKAVVRAANRLNVEVPMLSQINRSNRLHIDHAVKLILETGKKSVGMIGLSFKTGTDDLRESPLVVLAKQLIGEGIRLKVFDPEVQLSKLLGANRSYIQENIPHISSLMCEHCESLVEDSEVVVFGLHGEKYNKIIRTKARNDQVIVDLVGIPDRKTLPCKYIGVCW